MALIVNVGMRGSANQFVVLTWVTLLTETLTHVRGGIKGHTSSYGAQRPCFTSAILLFPAGVHTLIVVVL